MSLCTSACESSRGEHCDRYATVSLVNTFNAKVGDFCSSHGRAAEKRALEAEQRDWDRGIRNDGRARL